jgi:cyclohexyl-isocyanide hydratase
MKIGIPVYENVDMLDVCGPYEMFGWAGIEVELVAARSGPVGFRAGFAFEVKTGFAQAGDYDALWVPGGDPAALAELIGDPQQTYIDFLVAQAAKVRITASVCEGALLLAAAGLLDGYEATTHWRFIPCLSAYPAVKIVAGHPRFHLDRDRLTGGGISSGLDEALALIALLMGEETAIDVQQTTQYYPCPPVSSTIPEAKDCLVPGWPIARPSGGA